MSDGSLDDGSEETHGVDRDEVARLVNSCEYLVQQAARRYSRFAPHLFDDMVAEGRTVLCMQPRRFDPTRGASFYTFCYLAVFHGVRKLLQRQRYAVARPYNGYRRDASNPVRTESLTAEDENGESFEHDVAMDPVVFDGIWSRHLSAAMRKLKPRERKVLELRYSDDELTLDEIGVRFGVSRERIRQIERDALEKLRQLLQAGGNS